MKALAAIFSALCLLAQTPDPQSPPPYFDEPNFIVSGVADPSARGGHGSDPVLRSAESLAKATAALGSDATPNDAHPLEAVRNDQQAAEADPSEPNFFNWGAELLIHNANQQAIEVFSKGHRLFPQSRRLTLGLAVALYARGSYDQAAPLFFAAADLDPRDPQPYLFLGSISSAAITASPGYSARMARFARLHPESAWANYYYALTLPRSSPQARALFEKAVALDSHLGVAHLQLGIAFAEQDDLAKAIAAYRDAIQADPSIDEAHYRLALAYRKTGATEQAEEEMKLYQERSKESAEKLERERSRIQQFVFATKR